MTEPDRKQAQRKGRRGRRRAGSAQGRKRDDEVAAKASPQTEQPAAGAKPEQPSGSKDAAAAKPGNPAKEANVSSLLETSGNEVRQLLAAADEAAAKIREAAQADAAPDAESPRRNEAMSLVTRTNTEVQKVLEAAEDAGEKIREEARIEARQLVEETRRQAQSAASEQMDKVSRMTEELLGELGGMQERLQSLRGAFDQAMERMGGELSNAPTEVWDAKNGAGADDEDTAELRRRLGRRRKMVPQQDPEGISEGARLLALQQLQAGVDAEVIEERLSKEFGIKDTKPILDWMGIEGRKLPERRKSEKS